MSNHSSHHLRSSWKEQHHRQSLPVLESTERERPRSRYYEAEEDMVCLPPALPNGGLSYRARDPRRPNRHRKESLKPFEPLTARFLKNGDRFFEGVKMNVSQRNVRSWDALLSELSRRIDLPAGVRHIYAPETGHRVTELSQLVHNGVYVCGSTEPFRRIDYTQVRNPNWKGTKKTASSLQLPPPPLQSKKFPKDLNASMTSSLNASMNSTLNSSMHSALNASMNSTISDFDGLQDSQGVKRRRILYKRKRPMQLTSIFEPAEEEGETAASRAAITLPTPMTSKPFMITVIRNGPTPRHSASIYLNKESIRSWEEAKHLISENLHSINGCLRLFTLNGDEVQSLSQLWKAGDVLIAAGAEKFDIGDFLKGTVAASETTSHTNCENEPNHLQNSLKGESKELEVPAVVVPVQTTVAEVSPDPSPINGSSMEQEEEQEDNEKLVSKSGSPIAHSGKVGYDDGSNVALQTESQELDDKDEETARTTESIKHSTPTPSPPPPPPPPLGHDGGLHVPSLNTRQIPSEVLASNASGNNNNDGTVQPQESSITPSQPTSTIGQPHSDSRGVSRSLSQIRFPPTPTPSTGINISPVRHALANRRTSRNFPLAFNISQERSSSVASSDTDLDSPAPGYPMRHILLRKMYQMPNVRPQTPLSDITYEPHPSLVDMTLPKDVAWGDTDASVVSSSSSEERRRQSRTIGIQTEYNSNDRLSTTVDADDEQSLCTSDHLKRSARHKDSAASHTELVSRGEGERRGGGGGLEYKRRRELYHVGSVTHEGNFAAIRQCREKATGRELSLRVFNKAKMFAKDELILREIKIVRTLRNENVVQCFDHWETSDDLYLVMEQVVGSDLFDCILHCQHFSEADAATAMRQLGIALVYLHAKQIVHRDIKPENIFLILDPEGGWTLKVGGFSLATVINEPLSLVCGNRHYRSPEMITETGYGTKVDVWAAGVISYILLSGTMPFGRSKTNLFANIVSGKFSFPQTFWSHVSEPAKDFVRHCLMVWPQQRFSSSEMLQHPWLKDGTSSPLAQNEELSKSLTSMLSTKTAAKHLPAAPMLTITALEHMKSLLKHHLKTLEGHK